MIDVKQAVQIAKSKAAEMLDQSSSNLEEIERESYKDRDAWAITLSLPRDIEQLPPIVRLGADPLQYKRFFIDAENGDFLGMTLRAIVSR